ncbi:MAG: alpha/beta hydrolase fold domain-containing protein [Rubripirellula sp.]
MKNQLLLDATFTRVADFSQRILAPALVICWAFTSEIPSVCAEQPSESSQDTSDKSPGNDADRGKQVRVERNLRFSDQDGKAGLCDVYLPAVEPQEQGYPVVVVVHGGGWISGDKWTLETYSKLLAERGIAAVTINYRLAPDHKFPAQVDDVRSALIWAKQNAQRFQLNPECLGIFGYSAGGHLSTLVASLADESAEVQAAASDWSSHDEKWKQLPNIRAVCAGGPPCDFRSLPIDNSALAYFLGGSRRECPEIYVSASPAAHVSPADPVTQIIHGDSDLLVPLKGSQQFHEAQVAAGIDSRLEVMANQGHMVTFLNPETCNKVVDFFHEVFESNPTDK